MVSENRTMIRKPFKYGCICMLDALGTKGVWNNVDPNIFIKKIKLVIKSAKEIFKNIDLIFQNSPQFSSMKFKVSNFSDTIIITAQQRYNYDNFDYFSFLPIFAGLIGTIVAHGVLNEVFFRGAISHGEFIDRDSIFVGPAVDDAAIWHERADYIGVLLTQTAGLAVDSYSKINSIADSFLLKSNAPIKNIADSCKLYSVNWLLSADSMRIQARIPNKISTEAIIERKFAEKPIPEIAYNKYENTVKFLQECRAEINKRNLNIEPLPIKFAV